MRPRAVCDVVIDAHRERIRLLKDHADPTAQHADIHVLRVDILAVQPNVAGDLAVLDQIVHSVQALEECRFAAARRSDERRNLVSRHIELNILECVKIAVI